jgi:hypothetical protein
MYFRLPNIIKPVYDSMADGSDSSTQRKYYGELHAGHQYNIFVS